MRKFPGRFILKTGASLSVAGSLTSIIQNWKKKAKKNYAYDFPVIVGLTLIKITGETPEVRSDKRRRQRKRRNRRTKRKRRKRRKRRK